MRLAQVLIGSLTCVASSIVAIHLATTPTLYYSALFVCFAANLSNLWCSRREWKRIRSYLGIGESCSQARSVTEYDLCARPESSSDVLTSYEALCREVVSARGTA